MRYAWLVALAAGVVACDTTESEDFDAPPAEEAVRAPEANPTMGGASLQVATLADGGEYLTDAQGRALYLLEAEDEPAACVDACATAWPPFTLSAGQAPAAVGSADTPGMADQAPAVTANTPGSTAATIRSDLIDTVQRPDGSVQVTYNGHPLYYYAQDTQAGQPTGQDVHDEWGDWYLVDPSGAAQEAEVEAATR